MGAVRDAAIDRSTAVLAEALDEAIVGWAACVSYKEGSAAVDSDKAALARLRELLARFTRKATAEEPASDIDSWFTG